MVDKWIKAFFLGAFLGTAISATVHLKSIAESVKTLATPPVATEVSNG